MSGPIVLRGKALWVRSLNGSPTAAAFVDRYVRAGFSWASPIALWGGQSIREWDELYEALSDANVPAFPLWGLPEPETWRDRIDDFLDFAVRVGARGVIVDPEREWLDREREALMFAEALRAGCDARGLVLVFTSYSLPRAHPRFPWRAFLAVVDAAIAQTYDRDLAFDADYPRKAARQYRELAGPDVQIICAAGAWNHLQRRDKTPAQIARHLAILPRQPASIVWSDGSIGPAVWRELARWNVNGSASSSIAGAALGAVSAAGFAWAVLRGRRR